MPRQFHPSLLDHANNVWLKLKVMKSLIM